MVVFQLLSCYFIKDAPWSVVMILAYCVGGTINHSMLLAIHEIAHCLAFGYQHPLANKALGIFCNTVIGVPTSVTFRKYHLDHHRYQGKRKLLICRSEHVLLGGCGLSDSQRRRFSVSVSMHQSELCLCLEPHLLLGKHSHYII